MKLAQDPGGGTSSRSPKLPPDWLPDAEGGSALCSHLHCTCHQHKVAHSAPPLTSDFALCIKPMMLSHSTHCRTEMEPQHDPHRQEFCCLVLLVRERGTTARDSDHTTISSGTLASGQMCYPSGFSSRRRSLSLSRTKSN